MALIAGAGLRIAAVAGTLLMLFMFMACCHGSGGRQDRRGSTNQIVDTHGH